MATGWVPARNGMAPRAACARSLLPSPPPAADAGGETGEALDLRFALELRAPGEGRASRSHPGCHLAGDGRLRCPQGLGRNREGQGRQRSVVCVCVCPPPRRPAKFPAQGCPGAEGRTVVAGKDPVCACEVLLLGASRRYSNCFHGFCSRSSRLTVPSRISPLVPLVAQERQVAFPLVQVRSFPTSAGGEGEKNQKT